jgi:hypothetical protein
MSEAKEKEGFPGSEQLDSEKIKLERQKIYFDLLKWILGTVGIGVLTLFINARLNNRAASLNEMQFYDRYVTDLIVLNNKTGPRRLLAQYFSTVAPSDKIRDGWKKYYEIVNAEYQNLLLKDSITTKRIEELQPDSLKSTNARELKKLNIQRTNIQNEISTDMKIPSPGGGKTLSDEISDAENYYQSGSDTGKEEALRIYYKLSLNLTDLQKLSMTREQRKLLSEADEAYKNNNIDYALSRYYTIFRSFK